MENFPGQGRNGKEYTSSLCKDAEEVQHDHWIHWADHPEGLQSRWRRRRRRRRWSALIAHPKSEQDWYNRTLEEERQ